jgi:hypothetical protein
VWVVVSIAFLVTALSVWWASSLAAWSGDIALIGFYVVVLGGFSVLSVWPPRWVRVFAWALLAGVLASALRVGNLRSGSWNTALIPLGLLVASVVVLVSNRRTTIATRVSAPLTFPLAEGNWYIAQGGGRLLNHHKRVLAQRAALDLIRLRSDGRRAAGLFPSNPQDYGAYGSVVVSPCGGVLTEVVDGMDDEIPMRPRPGPPAGNHVVIDTGKETVLLAHLKRGSVRVRKGDKVSPGQPIGRVGNSGNSTEPHLHIHAEREGLGLQLAFTPPTGRLHRGRRIRAS